MVTVLSDHDLKTMRVADVDSLREDDHCEYSQLIFQKVDGSCLFRRYYILVDAGSVSTTSEKQ